jgi:hypothetical protein
MLNAGRAVQRSPFSLSVGNRDCSADARAIVLLMRDCSADE